MIMLKDGPLTIGYGRDLAEAVTQACDINRRIGSTPCDEHEMKAMIDAGIIKVREVES